MTKISASCRVGRIGLTASGNELVSYENGGCTNRFRMKHWEIAISEIPSNRIPDCKRSERCLSGNDSPMSQLTSKPIFETTGASLDAYR